MTIAQLLQRLSELGATPSQGDLEDVLAAQGIYADDDGQFCSLTDDQLLVIAQIFADSDAPQVGSSPEPRQLSGDAPPQSLSSEQSGDLDDLYEGLNQVQRADADFVDQAVGYLSNRRSIVESQILGRLGIEGTSFRSWAGMAVNRANAILDSSAAQVSLPGGSATD